MPVTLRIGEVPPDIATATEASEGEALYQPALNRWVRYVPRASDYSIHAFPLRDYIGLPPRETMQTAMEHYRKLEELGVPVASSTFYLTKPDHSKARVYIATEHIEGTAATELLKSPEGRLKLRELARPLMRYCTFIDTQSYYLWDLSPLEQYTLEHEPDQPIIEGQFKLTDPDPIMSYVHTQGVTRTTGEVQLGFVQEWADKLYG